MAKQGVSLSRYPRLARRQNERRRAVKTGAEVFRLATVNGTNLPSRGLRLRTAKDGGRRDGPADDCASVASIVLYTISPQEGTVACALRRACNDDDTRRQDATLIIVGAPSAELTNKRVRQL